MDSVFGRARHRAESAAGWASRTAAHGAVRMLHGTMGTALAEWLERSGKTPTEIDAVFAQGRARALLEGAFAVVKPEDVERFRAKFGRVVSSFDEEDFARILDAAATRRAVTMHVDVIGKLHFEEYVDIMNELRERFLAGLPLLDEAPPE